MNKLKEMVIQSMKKAHQESPWAEKDYIVDNLMPEVNKLCDSIIDRLMENENIEIKASLGYVMPYNCAAMCFDIIHHPISQEQNICANIWIKKSSIFTHRIKNRGFNKSAT